MATRVFELAKQLGVTSKIVLQKCRAEGIDVPNHMSTLSAGLEATIREWFGLLDSHTAVEKAQHVDLQEARAEAAKQRRKRHAEGEGEAEAPVGTETLEAPVDEEAPEAPEVPAEAPVAEPPAPAEAPEPVAVAAEAPEAPEAVVEAPPPAAEAVAEAPPAVEAVIEAPAPPEPVAAEPPAAAPPVAPPAPVEAVAQAPEAEAEAPAPAPEASAPEGEDEEKKPPEPIRPAGPQVVPRPAKLKGPRVVRVERPEPVTPRPSRAPMGTRGPAPAGPPLTPGTGMGSVGAPASRKAKGATTPTTEEDDRNKTKRRSPRRRGGTGAGTGRSAAGGEGVREWRDQDLRERSQRLAAATGGALRRRRPPTSKRGGDGAAAAATGQVDIDEPITVRSLSEATGIKASNIIRKLMEMGTFATVNQGLAREQAEAAIADFGLELHVRQARSAEEELLEKFESRRTEGTTTRAPVVTFLGHVDHGKTSLLDCIRDTAVASGEAGGITQHTGAYRYDKDEKHVVFLDTPGHEAFTAMRARGANMTDVVVLVVAADDGVMPQTVEAINHAKAAEVPIVVALNKIDMPNANPQRVFGQLAEHDLIPTQWGGNIEVIETSATQGLGIDTLVETLSLEAELLELKADPAAAAAGFVIEAEMDPGRGAVARLLVLDGTLKVGDILLAGGGYGRVRQMVDSHGKQLTAAGPSTPVEVSGLDELPEAGDRFYIVEELDEAREVAHDRRDSTRMKALAASPKKSLDAILGQIKAGEVNELALIVKADVQGTIEALTESLRKLNTEEVGVNILHAGAGAITTGDITLAEASDAIIIGFNVVADATARQLAENKGVSIRLYRVIYDVLDDVRKALEEGLAPEIKQETLGRAEVRQAIKISRVGTVAGCIVLDGIVQRNAKVRITRGGIVVEDERSLESLKRFKDDVREVRAGMECGMKVAGYDDVKEGDILEFYQQIEVARKL